MRARVCLAAVVAGALFLSACGDSGSSNESSSGGGGTSQGSSGELHLDKPVKLVLLAEAQGESQVAVDDYKNGSTMAVDEINAAGGIGGQKIELVRFPASPLDPQNSNSAYLKALDEKPAAIMGLPGGGTQVQAVLANIEKGAVPMLAIATGDDDTRFGAKAGSQYVWYMDTYTNGTAEFGTKFLIEELKAKKIGIMGTNEGYGSASISGTKKALKDAGLQPVAEKTYSPTATDLTAEVLAMKGADAVVDWGYPNPMGVQLTQFAQNDIDIPTINGQSAAIVGLFGLAKGDAINKLYSVGACNPSATNSQTLKTFAADYQKRFNTRPLSIAANAHDAVYVIKAAIEKAGSADPKKVNDALSQVTVDKGVVCQPSYKADGSHFFPHHLSVSKVAADGGTEVKTYTLPDLPKA